MNKWVRCWLLLAGALVAGCASDGGPVGTGVSTSAISGNVVSVQGATAPSIPPVQVSIDGLAGATTTTDSNGNFELSGSFAGLTTLRFTTSQFQATEQLDVPAGSAIVLQDIDLQPGSVDAQAQRQLGFFGTLDMVDCSDGSGTLLVQDRRHAGAQFLVRLGSETGIADPTGHALTCASLQVGEPVAVAGAIQSDQTIAALTVTVGAAPPPPQLIRPVTFVGAIAALDCTAGVIVVDDSAQRTRVQLTGQTQIVGSAGAPLGCTGLRLGDPVHGKGALNLLMPGLVVAAEISVGAPAPGQQLRIFGIVSAVDCASGALRLTDVMNSITVQLLPATSIVSRNGQQPLSCAAIAPGDRVSGTGQISPTDPAVIDALQLIVFRAGGGPP